MRGVQQFLFPEHDDLKTKIKDVDYIDISTISADLFNEKRKHPYELLPKDKFLIFKTGGLNRWRPKLGDSFPYIKNMETGAILGASLHRTYIRASITLNKLDPIINIELRLHRIAAEAFIINDNVEKKLVVDHINGDRLDYRIENLRWTTYSENNTGNERKMDGVSYEEKLLLGLKKL
tara:strand:+ start:466 stop:999 length:534 start_codon:yes stop_codon:yes gene_type:complete